MFAKQPKPKLEALCSAGYTNETALTTPKAKKFRYICQTGNLGLCFQILQLLLLAMSNAKYYFNQLLR